MGVHKKQFSEEQIAWLKENYDKKSLRDIFKHMQSSPETVYRLLNELNLVRTQSRKIRKVVQEVTKFVDIKMQDNKSLNKTIEACKEKARSGKLFGREVLSVHKNYCLMINKKGYRECVLWSDIAMKVREQYADKR